MKPDRAAVNGLERVWREQVRRQELLYAHFQGERPASLHRYLPTYADVGVVVHFDVPESVFPEPYVDFALTLMTKLNDSFQLRTADYTLWRGLTPAQMQAQYGLPANVASAVAGFLDESTTAGAPRLRFVLRRVQYRPAYEGFTVDVDSADAVRELKLARLPAVPQLFNVWVASLRDNVLGIGTFPFVQTRNDEFGVLVDYRSTDPAVQDVSRLQYADNRTMTHEVGHCLGLFHTFTNPNQELVPGGGALDDPLDNNTPLPEYGVGDGSAMTPPQYSPTSGDTLYNFAQSSPVVNPQGDVVCFVSFMDYTADPSMLVMVKDQVGRMEYFFQNNVRGIQMTDVVDTGVTTYAALPPPPPASQVELTRLEGGYTPGVTPPGGGGGGGGGSGSGLSTAAIIGIAVGAVALLALVIGLSVGLPARAAAAKQGKEAAPAAPAPAAA